MVLRLGSMSVGGIFIRREPSEDAACTAAGGVAEL